MTNICDICLQGQRLCELSVSFGSLTSNEAILTIPRTCPQDQRLSELPVSSTSLISKHWILSPGWKSAKPERMSPHSVPWPTRSTVSLCRLMEEQGPRCTSSPSRITRKLSAAAMVPSLTRHPATQVSDSPFTLTGKTWAHQMQRRQQTSASHIPIPCMPVRLGMTGTVPLFTS